MSALSLVNTIANNNNFISLPTKVASILRKYGTDAHLYMPGVGYLNGFAAGNYLESTGNTNASVDGAVGLVLDAAGSVGPNLVTSSSGVAGTYNGTTLVDDATNANHYVQVAFSSPANRTQITAKVKAGTKSWLWVYFANYTTGSVWFDLANGLVGTQETGVSGKITPLGGGEYEITVTKLNNTASVNGAIVATNANGSTAAYTGTNSVAFYARDIAVREVTGTHATQATTANKPILRRGIINLLTYSGDMTSANWVFGNASYLAGQVDPLGGNSAFKLLGNATNGQHHAYNTIGSTSNAAYTMAVVAKAAELQRIMLDMSDLAVGDCYGIFNLATGALSAPSGNPWQNVSSSIAPIPGAAGWYLCALTATRNATGTSVRGFVHLHDGVNDAFIGNASQGVLFYRGGIFQGALTAQQILAAGGIPLTTTAPASSQYGAYAWQFDGSNDVLALPGLLFQMADDHCVLAAGTTNGNGSISTVLTSTGGSSVGYFELDFAGTSNYPRAIWKDDAGTQVTLSDVAAYPSGCVMSGRKVGNSKTFRVNGTQKGVDSSSLAASVWTTSVIGARYNSSLNSFHNGLIYPVIAIKGTVSDADLRTLEKWLGSITGVSIA